MNAQSNLAPSTGAAELEDQIQRLEAANVETLKACWAEQLGRPAPATLHSPMLRRALAYRLQAAVYGDLPVRLRRVLMAQLRGAPPPPGLAVGTKLVRVWRGDTYVVEVVGAGFLWDGTVYSSLTQVAEAITGVHWNGPRFFGLRSGK